MQGSPLRMCLAAMMLLLLVACSPTGDAAILMTISTKVKITEIRARKNPDYGVDRKISKGMLKAIRRKYRRYKSFEKIDFTVKECRLGKNTKFTLNDGREIIIRIVGYQPGLKVVDLKIQSEDDIVAVSMKSNSHWVRLLEKKKEPVILVVTPTLLQIHKP